MSNPTNTNSTTLPITETTITNEAPKSHTMEAVFSATKDILDNLQDGQKIVLKDLIDKVVAKAQTQISITSGLVSIYIRDMYDGITIEKGRTGGIYKGSKKQRQDMRPRCPTCHQVWREIKNFPTLTAQAEKQIDCELADIQT